MASGIVNGRDYDFASIELKVGTRVFPVTAVAYGSPREVAKLFGNSTRKRGRTRGQLDETGSFAMYLSDAQDFLEYLTEEYGGFYEDAADFDIVATYGNNGQPVTTDTLYTCCLTDVQNDHSEGTDALQRSFEIDIIKIKYGAAKAFASD